MIDFKYMIREALEVTIITTNGYQMQGVIRNYDDNYKVLQLERADRKVNLVFLHAISTIVAPPF